MVSLSDWRHKVSKLFRRRRDSFRVLSLILLLGGFLTLWRMDAHLTTELPETVEFASPETKLLPAHQKKALLEDVVDVSRLVSKARQDKEARQLAESAAQELFEVYVWALNIEL
jgi:hypothetical protein